MKERPILFSAPMVLALLVGTKTQTRRALKVQPLEVLPFDGKDKERLWVGLMHRGETIEQNKGNAFRCKHGEPGDRLWVRETFCVVEPGKVADYRATTEDGPGKWTPSIFMPRWASRITLEVTGVRVERLQDISEADARAEGVESYVHESWTCWDPAMEATVSLMVEPSAADIAKHGYEDVRHIGPKAISTAKERYLVLWDTINGAGSAAKNPWVWCISFKRVAP